MSQKSTGRQFHPWSRHLPRLRAWSLVRVCATGNSSMFLSLSFSLSPPLSKRKYIKLPGLGTPGGSGYQAQSKRRGPTLCPPSKPGHQAAGEGTMGGTPADRFSKGQRAHGTLHRAHFHYIFQGNSARLATGYWLLIKERCGCQPEAVL